VTSLCEAKSGGEWFDFRWSSSDAGGVGPAFSFADKSGNLHRTGIRLERIRKKAKKTSRARKA
jgi:hypothetical protein